MKHDLPRNKSSDGRVIGIKFEQEEKQKSPRELISDGRLIVDNLEQEEKHELSSD
jgi:hypothetical protein